MGKGKKANIILVCIALALIILSILIPIWGKKRALEAQKQLDKMRNEAVHEIEGTDK